MCPPTSPATGPDDGTTLEPLSTDEALVTSLPGPIPRATAPEAPIDLSVVVENAMLATRDLATALGVAVDCHGPALLLDADGADIQRVLEDLLSTALRRNPSEGWVSVEMSPLPEGARVTVLDQGLTLGGADLRSTMAPTNAVARRLGSGLTTQDSQQDGNGISFTIHNRPAPAKVH